MDPKSGFGMSRFFDLPNIRLEMAGIAHTQKHTNDLESTQTHTLANTHTLVEEYVPAPAVTFTAPVEEYVKTTPQMTRFRDAKVCNNRLQIRIDDHRIQSDYKYKRELQNPEGKKSVLGIASAW